MKIDVDFWRGEARHNGVGGGFGGGGASPFVCDKCKKKKPASHFMKGVNVCKTCRRTGGVRSK